MHHLREPESCFNRPPSPNLAVIPANHWLVAARPVQEAASPEIGVFSSLFHAQAGIHCKAFEEESLHVEQRLCVTSYSGRLAGSSRDMPPAVWSLHRWSKRTLLVLLRCQLRRAPFLRSNLVWNRNSQKIWGKSCQVRQSST